MEAQAEKKEEYYKGKKAKGKTQRRKIAVRLGETLHDRLEDPIVILDTGAYGFAMSL